MSGDFTGARMDKRPKGHAKQLRAAQKECSVCWQVGGHDPRCRKAAVIAENRKRRDPEAA